MIDELRAWGLAPPVILGDGAYGEITEFRPGSRARAGLRASQVKGGTRHTPRRSTRAAGLLGEGVRRSRATAEA